MQRLAFTNRQPHRLAALPCPMRMPNLPGKRGMGIVRRWQFSSSATKPLSDGYCGDLSERAPISTISFKTLSYAWSGAFRNGAGTSHSPTGLCASPQIPDAIISAARLCGSAGPSSLRLEMRMLRNPKRSTPEGIPPRAAPQMKSKPCWLNFPRTNVHSLPYITSKVGASRTSPVNTDGLLQPRNCAPGARVAV